MSFKYGFVVTFMLSCLNTPGMAQTPPDKSRLVISNCMLNKVKDNVTLLAQSKQFSLIETVTNDELLQKLHDNKPHCGGFLNADSYNHNKAFNTLNPSQLLTQLTQQKKSSNKTQFELTHEKQVQQLHDLIDPSKIWQTSQHLTSYVNRSAKTKTGIVAAQWFKDQFDTLAQEHKRTDVDSYFVNTGTQYKQPSVVTLIGKDKPGDAIVIGAHIDTLSGSMPGADDDASGISVVVEVARVLLSSDLTFDHPVYLIAYAAEEQGLVGSSYVVQSFLDKKIPVKAVMQLDQAGYRANPKDTTIWLLKDYVDPALTQFTAELLTHYVHIPVAYTICGYACSDHANWSRAGFSATYPSATTLDDDNPYVHTEEDKLEILNLEHMVNFTKLGLAFVAELGLK